MTATTEQELAFAGPAALAERVRHGDVHPRELVELCLRRIEALDPQLNAFREVLAEEALAEADSSPTDGPLAGVPIAIKDDLLLAGHSATRGSRVAPPPSPVDAEVVKRLRRAGAVPIGITNVPERMIFPWTATEANGITRNPWNPSRTPGGSSGGSAAAVAAGMVPCATASDGAGSIRIPAAACGLVGMKSTRGRVSSQPTGEGWMGLSVYGALARTVRDSALMLDVIHGATADDEHLAPPFEGSYVEAAGRPPRRLRIAISRKLPPGLLGRIAADQRGAWERTAQTLSGLGHEIIERDPDYGLAQLSFVQTWLRAIYEEAQEAPDPSQFERTTRQMVALGRIVAPDRRKPRLQAKQQQISSRIMALWDDYDVLMTPALAKTAIAAEGGLGKPAPMAIDIAGRFTPFTPLVNYTGQPAVAVPAGVSSDGLPLSVQLVGRHGDEDLLYSLAGELEQAQPWAHQRPQVS